MAREIEHYNLPAILAVGYHVRSHRGTQFRQWATARLSEYLVAFYAEGELEGVATCKEYLQVRTEGAPDYPRADRRANSGHCLGRQ